MSDLKYKVDGRELSRLEAIDYYTGLAEKYNEPEKSAFLRMISTEFANDQHMENTKSKWQTIGVPVLGVLLLLFSVYMAFLTPDPSQYQSGVLWVVVCLATAISSIMIAGSIEYTNKIGIKAVGGFAIFCIMYFFVPRIYDKTSNRPGGKLAMFVVSSDSSGLEEIDIDFDKNSPTGVTQVATNGLYVYGGAKTAGETYTCYRKSDGKIYTTEICRNINEYEVIMICDKVCEKFGNKRLAYIHFKKQADSIRAR